jgi:hypothetical protein
MPIALNHINVTIAQKDVYPYNANKGTHIYTVNASPTTKVRFPIRADGTCVTTGETGLTKVSENPKVAGQIPLCESSLTLPVVGKVSIEGITLAPDWNTRVFRRDRVTGISDVLAYDPALTGDDLLKTQEYCKII